jgi:type II secretion system protein G
MKKKNQGFTLLELMIVMIILGVLAALISGNFISSLKKGRDAQRKQDLHQVQTSIELFYEDKHVYPDSISFGGELCENEPCQADDKKYMVKIPSDPLNTNNQGYAYCVSAQKDSYQLYAKLENTIDNQIMTVNPAGNCTASSCASGVVGSPSCNYGISSPNTTP